MTKSEAITVLVISLGNFAGSLTPLKNLRLTNKTNYLYYFHDAYQIDGHKSLFSEANYRDKAIDVIKNLPKDEQIEVMAILWGTIDADDIWSGKEMEYLINIVEKIGDLNFKSILSRYQEMSLKEMKKKMTKKIISVNDTIIWLTIEKDYEYQTSESGDKREIYSRALFCYFKLTKPKPFFYGELFRDSEGIPVSFHTVKEAISYAKDELGNRFSSI